MSHKGFKNSEDAEEFEEKHYVLRGGSYSNPSVAARCTCRLANNPKKKYPNIGFRLAETVKS